MKKITPQQIEAWVSRHFPDCKVKSSGKQLAINNPFDGDAGYHFWISLERTASKKHSNIRPNYWVHDFRPGHKRWDSSFLKFVQNYRKISFYDAIKEVCKNHSIARDILLEMRFKGKDEQEDEIEEKLIELPKEAKPISDENNSKARKIAINYLKNRCISEEKAVSNFVHYSATSVIFPYIEYGMMVYWQRRDIINKEFEFPLQTPGGPGKGDFVYGFDHIEPGYQLIIVEAIFDKLVIGNDAVATGGADITPKQIRRIKAINPALIILAPDNDGAGAASLKYNYYELKRLGTKLAYCMPPIASHESTKSDKNREYNDWNKYDQRFGNGWSLKYIENNSRGLGIASILKPHIGKIDVKA